MSRGENKDFCVTAETHVPDHHSLLPRVCETCTWLPRSYSGLFYGRRRVSVDNCQCTGAVVKVPESFCQFVQGSATRARLGRCGCDTCRLLFRSLRKVIFLLMLSCWTFCMLWSWSFPTACHWIGHENTSQTPSMDLIVVCLENAERLFAALRKVPRTRASPKTLAQISATKKRSVDVGCNGSTCSTTTQGLQQRSVVHSCIS